ncbi:MAG: hypothetical protein ABSA13_03425 [Beijerinckiaceae bacterium]
MPHVLVAPRSLKRLVCLRAPAIFAMVPLIVLTAGGGWSGGAKAAGGEAAQPGPAALPKDAGARAPLGPMQGDLGHPYYLPSASRARMHECALAWQHMKLSGGADNLTWRVFATGCLTAPDVKSGGSPGANAPDAKK